MIERIAKETTMDSTGAYQDSGQAELKKRITTYKATSSSEKRDFMLALVGGLIRCLAMFRGDMAAQAANVYGPIGVFPVGQQTGDPQLQMSGMPELAVLTGLTGIGRTVEGWNVTLPTDNLSAGTLAIASPASPKPRRLFAVSTGEALSRLVLDGIVEEDDPNTIIAVCS